jgi:PhnB protein
MAKKAKAKAATKRKAKAKTKPKMAAKAKRPAKKKPVAAKRKAVAKRKAAPKRKAPAKAKSAAKRKSAAKGAPAGYHSVTPYLIAANAAEAIEFYKMVFGATERMRMPGPDGKVGHAELELGSSLIMLADEYPEMNARSPKSFGGSPVTIMVYVEDVDDTAAKALAAGARELRPVENQFYGDRTGSFEDPQGHIWHVATRIEEVPMDELHRRAAAKAKEAAEKPAG